MAALTLNTWHYIPLAPFADPPYTVPSTAIPGAVIDYVIAATSFQVFCTALGGATSTFVYVGGDTTLVTVPNNAITIDSTPAMDTTVMDNGETWYSVRGATTEWYFYGDQAGSVRALTNSIALGNFIN